MDVSTADVLAQCSNEDLAPLVKYILEASTESLSSHELYKSHAPDHHQYAAQILQEIRLFGGNSFVNLFRKEGPEYLEVVQDVASKFGVLKASKFTSVTALEEELIQKILRDALKKADGQAREDMEAILKEAGLGQADLSALLSGSSLVTLLGAKAASYLTYELSSIIAGAVAKQLLGVGARVAGSAVLGRGIAALAGPIGWAITGVWTAIDLAGPAFRVTVPSVLHIAMLRQRVICAHATAGMKEAFND